MSDKRKKQKFAEKREQRRLRDLDTAGHLAKGASLPRGAVPADHSQQVPNNSYSPPPDFYVDIEFVCKDCEAQGVWTGKQQKWYYEVAKGSLFCTAVRCHDCRQKHTERHSGRGDPNPIKHVGSLMKSIREKVSPWLIKAGFEFEGKSNRGDSPSAWLDYSRPSLDLRILFDPQEARLIAETMDDHAECDVIASVELDRASTLSLLDGIDEFSSAVVDHLRAHPAILAVTDQESP